MRYVSIDLSSDNYLEQPQIFGGYAGEHNETILQVKLPERMIDIECSGYRFDFQTSEDNKISSPLIPISELNDGIVSFKLSEQLTIAGKLLFNVAAVLLGDKFEENLVSLISKTSRVILYIEDSTEGNVLLIDPNGYKDELQQIVDERVSQIGVAKGEKGEKGEKGDRGASGVYVGSGDMPDDCNVQIDPNGSAYEPPVIDQTYNPESENAQSGKAVAEAVSGKADKEEWIQITEITLAEDAVVSITTDKDGNSFALKKIYIRFNTPAVEGDSTSTSIWLHTRFTTNAYEYQPFLATKSFPRNKTKHGSFEAEIKAFWYGEARCTSSGVYGEDPSNLTPYGIRTESINANHITGFKLCEGYSGAIPNGTYIEIWGVRA